MSKKIIFGAIASAVLALSAGSAFAAGGKGTLNVTLGVKTGCDINGASGIGEGTGQAAALDFGDQIQGASNVIAQTASNGASALVVTCSATTYTPSITLDGGEYYLGKQRQMRSDATIGGVYTFIPYSLGSASSLTDYTPGYAINVANGGIGVAVNVPVWGFILQVPTTAQGSYSDMVKVSLSF
jgi:spore coat protein U-like protein